MKIALDAMGGDAGPSEIVAGAAQVTVSANPVDIVLVGDREVVARVLGGVEHDPKRVTIVDAAHAPVAMEESPKRALSERPECSIAVACRLVAQGHADALVSAGHTGASILAASQQFQRIEGIRRTALAAAYPTEQVHGPRHDHFALILDVGATVEATAQDLVGFAVMGSAYAGVVFDNEAPKVALLSNGSEPNKGTPCIREAHSALERLDREGILSFHGNVEGLDIPRGTADVVVCDGFLGNVVLKMLEGVSDVVLDLAKKAYSRKILWRVGLMMLSGGIKELRGLTDWKQVGGAPLLGFDRIVIKAHGRSNAQAIRNAVHVAAKAAQRDLIGQINERLAQHGAGN